MEQAILIDPVKLTPEQVNDRAQKLVDALMQRDLLVVEAKNAANAAKEEIAELDKKISQLRGEIRESRPSPPFSWSLVANPSGPLCTDLDTHIESEVEG